MNDPVREEIEFHIEERARELVAEGHDPAEARRLAEAAFGDVSSITTEVGRLQRRRDHRSAALGVAESLRAGLRGVVRHPRYASLVVGILALGIGATVAIFTLVDAVLIDPLPFEDPDRLVRVMESDAERPNRNPAPADFLDLRALDDAFTAVTAFVPRGGNLLGEGSPERVRYADVSANFFQTLGVHPRPGRSFGPETVDEGVRPAVVSHALWTRRWGVDPGVVGRTLDLDGERFEVVGVAPEGFEYPAGVALWVAARFDIPAASFFGADAPTVRDAWYHTVVARMAPGVGIELAADRVAALAAELRSAHPETFGVDADLWLTPLRTDEIGDLRTPLLLLFGATALVLLIVAVNVANLALVRAAGRAKEWGVRVALGAPRSRVAALVLAESLVVGVVGGVLGVAFAALVVRGARPSVAPLLPVTTELALDSSVLAFALLLSLTTAVAFGLGPAVAASKRAPGRAIDRGAGARAGSRRDRRLRDAMVATEVALAVVLVLGAGLLLRSLASVRSTDMGFRADGLVTMSVGSPGSADLSPVAQVAYWSELTDRLAALPGVERVALGQFLPSEVGAGAGLRIQGRATDGPDLSVRWHTVSAGYFETAGIDLIAGRTFDGGDRAETESVAVVNETLARRFFPDGDAIGNLVNTGLDGRAGDDWRWLRVVGVVRDTRNLGPERPADPMLYRPMAQAPPGFMGSPRAVVHLRSSVSSPAVVPTVRAAIREVHPGAPVDEVLVGDEIVAGWFARRELVVALVGGFALLALLLGAVGVYGLTHYAVQSRTREIGVRMAIGAERSTVVALVVRQGLVPALAGLGAGGALALVAARAIESRLYGIQALDPFTWAGVSMLLVAVATLATWIPARRAARIDPVEAIRSE